MNLAALFLVRNSDWCIGLSLRSALLYCDHAVVLMHRCEDNTFDIVTKISLEHPGKVIALLDNSNHWEEMRLRQRLLDEARRIGSTHVMLVDDDECLSANLLPSIRAMVERCPTGAVMQLPWLSLRDGVGNVMITSAFGKIDVSCAFRDHPSAHWQAEGPWKYDHHHRHPKGIFSKPGGAVDFPWRPSNLPRTHLGGIMHLQFSSRRRLLAKQALYQVNERLRWPNREMPDYVGTVRESDKAQTDPVPAEWWERYYELGWMKYLRVDAEPWQERAVMEMVREHGIERFAGLELVSEVLAR